MMGAAAAAAAASPTLRERCGAVCGQALRVGLHGVMHVGQGHHGWGVRSGVLQARRDAGMAGGGCCVVFARLVRVRACGAGSAVLERSFCWCAQGEERSLASDGRCEVVGAWCCQRTEHV